MEIVKSIFNYGLFVGIAILVLSSCRTICPPRKRFNPVNYVEKSVFVNGEQYIITEDTVPKRT